MKPTRGGALTVSRDPATRMTAREAENRPGTRLPDLSTLDAPVDAGIREPVQTDGREDGSAAVSADGRKDGKTERRKGVRKDGNTETRQDGDVLTLRIPRDELSRAKSGETVKTTIDLPLDVSVDLNVYTAKNKGTSGRSLVVAFLRAFLDAEVTEK